MQALRKKENGMDRKPGRRRLLDGFFFVLIIGLTLGISFLLARVNNDNNPFAMAVFILAVAVVARVTEGYFWGVAASVAGTLCVNYFFSYPFWSFDITYPGYPLTMTAMLIVSVLISTLTTQIKRQERFRFEMEREKMHANLLRAIAHDIRTPLSAIMGASSALKAQALDEADREALLDGINRDAQWLVRVTENLLSVTRFTGGDVALTKTDEVLEEIVGSAILKYRRAPDALPVQVTQPEQILIVPMDATLIEQVLINLFDNVSAHGKTATRIWLDIACAPGSVTLRVEDDGVGIPTQLLPGILDGSARHDMQARSDDRRSMGIGLSVCRTIVRAHGGDMKVGSSSHGGAAVSFYLPFSEEYNGQ